MKYVAMRRDELGDVVRCDDKVYEFPDYDSDDIAMDSACIAWRSTIEEQLNNEWREQYGPESYIFLEVLYSDYYGRMSLSQLEAIAEMDMFI